MVGSSTDNVQNPNLLSYTPKWTTTRRSRPPHLIRKLSLFGELRVIYWGSTVLLSGGTMEKLVIKLTTFREVVLSVDQ